MLAIYQPSPKCGGALWKGTPKNAGSNSASKPLLSKTLRNSTLSFKKSIDSSKKNESG